MDDLLDLSFSSESGSNLRLNSALSGLSQANGQSRTSTPNLPQDMRPASAASTASIASRASYVTNPRPTVPKKKAEDSFASLVSFSSAKRAAEANKSLNERMTERGSSQFAVPAKVDAGSDWASGLSFDTLDSAGLGTPVRSTVTDDMKNMNLLDDEDILGPLAEPAQPATKSVSPPLSTPSPASVSSPAPKSDPRDRALAELVDMGFSDDQARRALSLTDTGVDVQQAIDVLLMQAHAQTRPQPQRRRENDDDVLAPHPDDRLAHSHAHAHRARQQHRDEWQNMPSLYSDGSTSDATAFKMPSLSSPTAAQDFSKLASGLSSQLRSRAEVLWKQGKRTVAKAVEEYQASGGIGGSGDESNPKWMHNQGRYRYDQDAPEVDLEAPMPEHMNGRTAATLEASLLEQEPPPKPARPSSRPQSRAPDRTPSAPSQPPPRPISQVSRSSARRESARRFVETEDVHLPPRSRRFVDRESNAPAISRRPAQPSPRPLSADLLQQSRPPTPSLSVSASAQKSPAAPASPTIPARPVVKIMSIVMDEISMSRSQGTDAFKRGDFTTANEEYTKALNQTPSPHLLRVVLLSNRAACLLKLGNPKSALADADEGLSIIGPTKGIGENYEPGKALVEIWVKLFQRRSEALEQLERFKDARDSWDVLVQSGKGGNVALEGKRRCDNVLDPKPKSVPSSVRSTPRPASRPVSRPTSTRPQAQNGESAALKRLEEINAAAEAEDAQKFALHDAVEQKLGVWKMGKEDNLRALLASLDTVLWAEAGWTSVHMADLVMPKKVKINYMKAVAKTHPDKVAQSATVEQKMIAQGIFVSLNHAWDEFKKSNVIQ
ncbi:hypothetical protein V1512DRAFT_259682 [Lipomyces arxii]|uniref:uncharacterized protein n=1 Tax=Lipomyces arxii TaxID=56418 RepID=UPI0034CD42D8